MLSSFPELLFLSPLAATLIRLALTAVFAYSAWRHMQHADMLSRALSVGEIAIAVALAMGAWTQPAALFGLIVSAIWFFQPSSRTLALSSVLLTFVMCLTLLMTGAGAFAFDLPL